MTTSYLREENEKCKKQFIKNMHTKELSKSASKNCYYIHNKIIFLKFYEFIFQGKFDSSSAK